MYNLLPVLTAAKNVELPLLLTKLGSGDRKKRVQTALSVVGLGDRANHYPRQLSGGKEQRVSSERARKELGWKPRPYEDSVADTLRWVREKLMS